MTFLTPLAFTLFAPWMALAWWLLTRRHESTHVPFVNLWKTEASTAARPRRTIRKPPVAELTLIAALALAIVASARPVIRNEPRPIAHTAAADRADIRIVDLAARVSPKPAMMVRVRNDSTASNAKLVINLDGSSHEEVLDALPTHADRDYFFDLPSRGRTLSVALRPASDDVWKAARCPSGRIEPLGALSPELSRMLQVYARSRPAPADATAVVVTDSLNALADRPGVVVAHASDKLDGSDPPRIAAHAITKNIADPRALLRDAVIATDAPRDWTPLIIVDDHVLLAIRETPSRQVWIGFASPSFARSPAFVVFWTDVLDWLSEQPDANAATFAVDHVAPATASEPIVLRAAVQPLAPFTLIASLIALIGAMMLWPRRVVRA